MRRLLFGLTVLLLVCLFAIQPLLSYVLQEASVWPDLTEEGLYTASGALLATLSGLKQDVTIIFCAAPDYLLGNVETRAPYITCKKLARENFAHLAPSRVNVVLEYSHPPLSERIAAVEKEMEKNMK